MGELLIHRRVPRVLVVDDNPDMAELMRELLASRGYDVCTVPDADQAEMEVRRHLPDLILSDVVMPGRSGYELCRQLKEDPSTRLIPFLLITGLSDREDKVKGIEAGADDFLNKPIFPAELFARVKSLLKLKEFTAAWKRATLTRKATANASPIVPCYLDAISVSTKNP